MAARISSSEMSRPADSIAPSSVASVWRGGGRVCLVTTSSLPSRRCPSASGGSSGAAVAVRAAALAELRDRLPAGDQPHPTARAVAIGRRRQRRHERLVARVGRVVAASARRPRAVRPRADRRGSRRPSARTPRRGGRPRESAARPDRRCAARRGAGRRGSRACPWGRWRGGRSPCRRRTRGASARAASRAAAPRTARSRAARPAPRTAWAAPSPMSLVR